MIKNFTNCFSEKLENILNGYKEENKIADSTKVAEINPGFKSLVTTLETTIEL